jgi:stearoyl-CoA desaturase (delta-9 desaturase)
LDLTGGSALSIALTFAASFVLSYYYHAIGITLGYHRLLTHKALKMPKWLTYLVVSGGYLVLMGGPVNWVGVHRLHHQKSDQPEDPHSPVQGGFKHALYGWMFTMADRQTNDELRRQVPDLLQDKGLCWFGVDHCAEQAKMCLAFCILFRFIILGLFGWAALAGNLVATFLVFWSPQLVNAVCHDKTQGYRLFDTRDESRNVWWVGLMALGEGWHNNHHAIPRSAQHGMAWWEFDVTWLTILFLEKLGLATDVVRPKYPPTRLAKVNASTGKRPLAPAEDDEPVEGPADVQEAAKIETVVIASAPVVPDVAPVVKEPVGAGER